MTSGALLCYSNNGRFDHAEDSRCVSVRCKSPAEENQSIDRRYPFSFRKGFFYYIRMPLGISYVIKLYAHTEYTADMPPVLSAKRSLFGIENGKGGKKMAKVELKKPVIEEISESVKDAQSVVLVDYRGLTVEQDTNLRKQLREAGVTYKVYKNTMMNFAFKDTDFEALAPYLEGPSAVAISKEDATAPARVLTKFAKTAPKLEIKGGVVEGVCYDAKGMDAIAKIPSREELLSKLLGSIQSPITNFARVMSQLAEKGGAGECEAPVKEEAAPVEEAPVAETAEAEAAAPVEEAAPAEAEAVAPAEETAPAE